MFIDQCDLLVQAFYWVTFIITKISVIPKYSNFTG